MTSALIVDDSTTVRFYYRDILEGVGFIVDEALNGMEALEKVMTQPFGLVVVDVNMPKMHGYAFLDQLRRHPELRAMPAIMISTEAGEGDRARAYASGANVYLVKPVDPAELASHATLMTGRRPVEQALP